MSPHDSVTPREQEVLRELARGLSNKQMATVLGVAPSTIEIHLNKIYRKLGVENRPQAVIAAIFRHLVSGKEQDHTHE